MYTLCGYDKIEKELAQSRVAITRRGSVVDRPVAAIADEFYLHLAVSINEQVYIHYLNSFRVEKQVRNRNETSLRTCLL